MRKISRALLFVGLSILFTTISIAAQQRQARDSDLLRTKIEQFEQTDLASKSASVRSIYQRTLLRLYNEFNKALLQDISDLTTMQSLVGGTSAESQKEVALLLRKLRQEQGENAEKIDTLSGDLQTVNSSEHAAPRSARASTDSDAQLTNAVFNAARTRSTATAPTGIEAIPASDSLAERIAETHDYRTAGRR